MTTNHPSKRAQRDLMKWRGVRESRGEGQRWMEQCSENNVASSPDKIERGLDPATTPAPCPKLLLEGRRSSTLPLRARRGGVEG
eukprot:4900447-Pleurochrysis_carterae.AAC.3